MSRVIALVALLLTVVRMTAQDDCLPAKPSDESRLVWQFTPFLGADEERRLDAKLSAFARETSNRIAVVVVDTLCGLPASDFAFQLGEAWGIGDRKFDNGVVVLIKPTGPAGRRDVFIAVGYGLEGAIPDLTCRRIIENELVPAFRDGRYHAGLDRATTVLMKLAKGEFDHRSYGKEQVPWPVLIVLLVVVVFMIFGSIAGARKYARTNKVDLWTALWLMSQMQKKHRGTWGGFSGGGGFGGGGFGGFGGGGFGGGGAGGRW